MRDAPGPVATGPTGGAPTLFGAAVARRLVTVEQVLSGRVSVTDVSRSNLVHRLDVDDRPVAFVKTAGAAALLDGDQPVVAEHAALTALAGLAPRGVVPHLVPGPPDGTVWTRAVHGIPLYAVRGAAADVQAVCRRWGGVLAQLHRWGPSESTAASVASPMAGAEVGVLGAVARPWVLDPDRLPASMGRPAADSPLAALVEAARSPQVRALAATVAADWAPSSWLHGDLSAANVLVSGPLADAGVHLVDFESAGLGPASWDLATALDTLGTLVRTWGVEGVVESFVAGYRSGGGPGRVDPAQLAVRALVTGWQISAGLLARGDVAGARTEARLHVERAGHWAARVRRGGAVEAGAA